VYITTFEDLVRFLYRKVWDSDRARDLAQDAFVRGLKEEPDDPRAWLFTVAGNLARDEARTAIRRKQHLALLKSETEPHARDNPEQELERQEQVTAVRRALDALSDRDRDVLLLWDAGFDYTAIATETGLSLKAIGTTLARARRRLVEAHGKLEGTHAAHR
jgi:RNA polymerase sigma-70 factor (ECF subfamily)